jgi:hypothetical protein
VVADIKTDLGSGYTAGEIFAEAQRTGRTGSTPRPPACCSPTEPTTTGGVPGQPEGRDGDTWLEDPGTPARVIDELMGHAGGRRNTGEGSAIGVRYRHTTPEMEARAVAAIEQRLAVSLAVARLCRRPSPASPDGLA